MKTLFVVSGGIEAVPGIRKAKQMGLFVVVSDGDPQAPGFDYADDHVVASTYDVTATVAAAKKYHNTVRRLDGVICISADVPLTVASVAAELQLPGIPVEAARLAGDKLAMKERFVRDGIAVPWFSQIESAAHLKKVFSEHAQPLVIKPVDSRGARGVLRLTNDKNLDWAFEQALTHSPSRRVMVEEYISGPQVSTESILFDDKSVTPGFIDRNYELLEKFTPYIIENGGHQPTILNEDQKRAVSDLVVRAGRSLGVTRGTVKGDMVLSEKGPLVIEIATRLSGGWMSTDQIPLATGVDFVGAAIKMALGESIEELELEPRHKKGVAIRYFFPLPGQILDIKNQEKFIHEPWVYKLHFFAKPGDKIEAVTNHTKRAGFVIATGDSREQAVLRAEQVVKNIVFEMK